MERSNGNGRIDVHAHYITDQYRAALLAAGIDRPDGMPAIPQWNSNDTLAMMDRLNIQTAILSVSSPGIHFGDNEAARKLARLVNDEGAQIVKENPGRFGLFASLPLPDLDGAMEELHYVFDVLKADGVVLETNYHGLYLGDEKLEQIFQELDKRKGIVFIHPTSPSCSCCNELALGYPRPVMEFMFETTRSVTNLILMGVTSRYPNVKIIVPHAGAALPVLADRIAGFIPVLGLKTTVSGADLFQELKGLYFDLAGIPLPRLLPALLSFADERHILYGSDYPFTPENAVGVLLNRLENGGLSEEQLQLFMYENARRLFPGFKS